MNEFTFAVTTSPRAYLATSHVFAGHPTIHVGLGLHPEVAVRKASELPLLVELVAGSPLVGEIGLDGSSRFRNSLALQTDIFSSVVKECAKQGGRIMSIHSRGAEAQVLDILEKCPRAGTGVLHWFSGTLSQLRRAIEMGCWFSVGPAMLAFEKGRRLVGEMPPDRVLPETDGPFGQRLGNPLMPWEAGEIAVSLAKIWRTTSSENSDMFRANLKRLLLDAQSTL